MNYCRLGDSCPVQKTLKTMCKLASVRWWAPETWWEPPHFKGRSGYSAEWQFRSMRHISLRKAGMFYSLVYLTQISQPEDFTVHMCVMVFCIVIRNLQIITQEQSAHLSWHLFIFISQSFYAEQRCFVLQDFCTLALLKAVLCVL